MLHRLDCVLLVAEGRSMHEVADWFAVDQRTIQRWVHAAYASGIAGLAEHHNGGRPAKLTPKQQQSIQLDLQATPMAFGYPARQWTGKRLAFHLERRYAVKISIRSCQRMIVCHRAGLAAQD